MLPWRKPAQRERRCWQCSPGLPRAGRSRTCGRLSLLLRLWEEAVCARLRDGFDEAFGGMPGGVAVRLIVVRARPGPALAELADQPDDLLVVGYGGWSRLGCAVHGSVTRYCMAHARCPVLAVPLPFSCPV